MPTLRWFGGTVRDVRAVDRDRARGRLLEAGDHPQRRRLAAARRPEERHELAPLGGQVEVLDGDDVAERFWTSVSSRKPIGLASVVAQRAPAIWTRVREPRPRTAMRPIAIQVSPKLMSDDRGRLVRLRCRPSSDRYGPNAGAGQEARDRELADDDGQGQERARQERRPEVREDDPPRGSVNQPAPRLCAASVSVRTSIAAQARVDRPVHVRERQDHVGRRRAGRRCRCRCA